MQQENKWDVGIDNIDFQNNIELIERIKNRLYYGLHKIYEQEENLVDQNRPISKILLYFYDYYNEKNKRVDWEAFGGYEQFRDYYIHLDDKFHLKERYFQVQDQEREYQYDPFYCNNCGWKFGTVGYYHTCHTNNDEIYDLQLPYPQVISRYIINKDLLYEEDEMEHLSPDQKKILKNCQNIQICLCGAFIDNLEQVKNLFQYVINVLFLLKSKNKKMYDYLKSLRKDKVFQILQFLGDEYQFQCSQPGENNFISIFQILNQYTALQEKQQRKRQYFNEYMELLYEKAKQQKNVRDLLKQQGNLNKKNLVIENKQFILKIQEQKLKIKSMSEKIEELEKLNLKEKQQELQIASAEQDRKKILEQNRLNITQKKQKQQQNKEAEKLEQQNNV